MNFKYQSSVWTGEKVILWGGFDEGSDAPVKDGFIYNYFEESWETVSTEGSPSARSGHSAAFVNDKMYIFGGLDNEGFVRSSYVYDLKEDSWSELADLPSDMKGRAYATAEVFDDKVYLWGGMNDNGTLNSGWIFDVRTESWEKMVENPEVKGRISFTSVVTNDSLIIWGGQSDINAVKAISDGWSYNFTTDKWSRLEGKKARAPKPRMHHAAVWTGEKMVVWGGADQGRVFRTGLFYDPVKKNGLELKQIIG